MFQSQQMIPRCFEGYLSRDVGITHEAVDQQSKENLHTEVSSVCRSDGVECRQDVTKKGTIELEAVEFFRNVLLQNSSSACELPLIHLLVTQFRASWAVREVVGEYSEFGFVRFLERHPDVFLFADDKVSLREQEKENEGALKATMTAQRVSSPFQDISNIKAPGQMDVCSGSDSPWAKCIMNNSKIRAAREQKHFSPAVRPLFAKSAQPKRESIVVCEQKSVAAAKVGVQKYSATELYAIRDDWLATNPPALKLPPLEGMSFSTERYDRFEQMNLKVDLLRGIHTFGLAKPSVVQQFAITPCCSGRDVVTIRVPHNEMSVSTIISILQRIDAKRCTCQALILVPSFEVAAQIYETVSELGVYLKVNCFDLEFDACGCGCSPNVSGAQIIVGTPKRVASLLQKSTLEKADIQIVAVEKADAMFLPKQFMKAELNAVLSRMPKGVQVLFSCKHFIPEVGLLSLKFMTDPVRICVPDNARASLTTLTLKAEFDQVENVASVSSEGRNKRTEKITAPVFACSKRNWRDEGAAVVFYRKILAAAAGGEMAAHSLFGRRSQASRAVRRAASRNLPTFTRFLAAHPAVFEVDGDTVRLRAATRGVVRKMAALNFRGRNFTKSGARKDKLVVTIRTENATQEAVYENTGTSTQTTA